jgi:hypothetical protein
MGLDPVTRPVLRGRTYVLRAFDGSHKEKRVLVDAHSGEVLSARATAEAAPAYAPYNPRYGRYDPPRPPGSIARVATVPDAEPILDEPLFPRAGRGAPAAVPAPRSAALTPQTPSPKVAPAPAAPDATAAVSTNSAPVGATAPNSTAASPLPSAEVLAAAPSVPGKSVPAPVAARAGAAADGGAKAATAFVPVAPLE